MQNFARIALGLGAAALVASGGSAFTAGIDVDDKDTGAQNLGHSAITLGGIEVSDIEYQRDGGSGATLTAVVFTLASGNDLADTRNDVELRVGTSAPGGTTYATYACTTAVAGGVATSISCGTGGIDPNAVDETHLTITPAPDNNT